MTDDNVRPESHPSRESRPEVPDEGVVDESVETGEGAVNDIADEAAAGRGDAGESVEAQIDPEDADAAANDQVVEAPERGQPEEAEAVVVEAANEPGNEADTIVSAPEKSNDSDSGEAAGSDNDAVVDEITTDEVETGEPEGTVTTDEAVTDESTVNVEAEEPQEPATEAGEAAEAEAGDSTVATPDAGAAPGDQRSDTFTWHPEHRGKTFDEVRSALAQDIAADQRQHRLAMDGAEESEQEALASVVGLERKWGKYDFDWAEQEPDALADRIVTFEQERERRQEMISWGDYRDGDVELDEAQVTAERPAELSTSAKGLSLLLVVLLIVVILLAVWAL